MTQKTTAARPLVTFALFAYNQEKYIREAVEGAFSQTYEPLEIILSDDYSPVRARCADRPCAVGPNGREDQDMDDRMSMTTEGSTTLRARQGLKQTMTQGQMAWD